MGKKIFLSIVKISFAIFSSMFYNNLIMESNKMGKEEIKSLIENLSEEDKEKVFSFVKKLSPEKKKKDISKSVHRWGDLRKEFAGTVSDSTLNGIMREIYKAKGKKWNGFDT
ncbi:MAG: hypothetical protein L6Q54_15675 [Leptospiraceae bacterium]|nr:hypothetical protein [Leptospiraceae bacterium]NUM42775.1 hypothetical protein [Leptospiraceae bacterium]